MERKRITAAVDQSAPKKSWGALGTLQVLIADDARSSEARTKKREFSGTGRSRNSIALEILWPIAGSNFSKARAHERRLGTRNRIIAIPRHSTPPEIATTRQANSRTSSR